MLRHGKVASRLPAQDLDRARAFYAEKLGLEPVEEREGGLRYVGAQGEFGLFASAGAASGDHTQMGWEVDDIEATVRDLRGRGVVFEEYELPGLTTVDGIADIEGNYPSKGRGERGAWFRDSEGNVLGIGQPIDRPAAELRSASGRAASEVKKLEVLVGRWQTRGSTRPRAEAPAAEIVALDTYDWLAGGFGMFHRVDGRVGDQWVEGAEVIGYDPERAAYITQYFGSDGPAAYEASFGELDGALTWTMRSKAHRFTGTFSDDGNSITGHWELHDGSSWHPWMDITLTKQHD
jgi:catechol 2,3-dioxygenase-like lactoylglutathione lyase family enzyme